MFIVIVYVVCGAALISSSFLGRLNVGLLPSWIGWLGIIIALAGFGLRVWSMSVLGKFYTRTLKVTENSIHRSRGTVSLHPSPRLSRLDPDLVRCCCFDAELDRPIDCVDRYVQCLYLPNSKRREDAYLHES